MDNYQLLIARLDAFIRKFYANKLIRGLLIFLASAIAFYVLASLGEYYFYFPSWLRYALLIVFIGIGGFALIYLIMIPLLQMQKLGKVISHEKAAAIIGTHFPDVQDKLLNVLQLKQGLHNTISKDLIAASIEQKTKELTPVHFQAAVNFATNKRYLPCAATHAGADLYAVCRTQYLQGICPTITVPLRKICSEGPLYF